MRGTRQVSVHSENDILEDRDDQTTSRVLRYQISKTSKMAKNVCMTMRIAAKSVLLRYRKTLFVTVHWHGQRYHYAVIKHPLESTEDIPDSGYTLLIINEHPESEILRVFGQIIDIFKCFEKPEMVINAGPSYEKERLIELANYLNSKTKERKIFLYVEYADDLEHWPRIIKDPLHQICVNSSKRGVWNKLRRKLTTFGCRFFPKHSMRLSFGKHSGIKCETFFVSSPGCITLPQLMSLDFVRASFHSSDFSSAELNILLKSWKNQKTHHRMEKMLFFSYKKFQFNDILKGLNPMEKFKTGATEETQIQRRDGKTMIIQSNRAYKPFQLEFSVCLS